GNSATVPDPVSSTLPAFQHAPHLNPHSINRHADHQYVPVMASHTQPWVACRSTASFLKCCQQRVVLLHRTMPEFHLCQMESCSAFTFEAQMNAKYVANRAR